MTGQDPNAEDRLIPIAGPDSLQGSPRLIGEWNKRHAVVVAGASLYGKEIRAPELSSITSDTYGCPV